MIPASAAIASLTISTALQLRCCTVKLSIQRFGLPFLLGRHDFCGIRSLDMIRSWLDCESYYLSLMRVFRVLLSGDLTLS